MGTTPVPTAIIAARVFDGTHDLGRAVVTIDAGRIVSVSEQPPPGAEVIDAPGATLLPGLIDAHVHTDEDCLALALRFGVTTELEMQGANTAHDRGHLSDNDQIADVRSAGFGLTPPGGHPEELFPKDAHPHLGEREGGGPPRGGAGRPRVDPLIRPQVRTAAEAVDYVRQLANAGSDYIKFMVDDGTVEGHPGLPMLSVEALTAGIAQAHRLGKLTVAHALTIDATRMCIDAGIDGLAHLFMDQPHTPDVIDAIAQSGAFVIACVTLNASMIGITGAALADDPRVASRLPPAWDNTLRSSFNHYPQGQLSDVLASLHALHAAGVDLLVGTDVSQPLPFLGGLAHGASVHQEMQYFVAAGLSPAAALTAATATTARRFGLTDRGTIAHGQRADLLLVDGDPTTTITDTLNIRDVWRRGVRLATA